MRITLNGRALELNIEDATYGDVLAAVDELVDGTGDVIVKVLLDGKDLSPDDIMSVRDKRPLDVSTLDFETVSSRSIRIRAYETALEAFGSVRELVRRGADPALAAGVAEEVPGMAAALRSYRDVFGELIGADEVSFLMELERALAETGTEPAAFASIQAKLDPLVIIFSERLSELNDPARAMKAASVVFKGLKSDLGDVPIKLQTGRDGEAFQSILRFIELFNKANRILPLLGYIGVDGDAIRPDGVGLKDFYESINAVLRQMMEAFERKDSVLLGDIVEYEIVPRMSGFFQAVESVVVGA